MSAAWIDYSFKVALCLGATYLFYHVLLRDDVNFLGNRLYLLFMLPLSFLLPMVPLQSPFRSFTVSAEAFSAVAALPAVAAPAAEPFASALIILYWAGVALFMLRILFHLFHLYRLQLRHPRERLNNLTLVRIEAPIPPFSFFNRIFLHTPKNSAAREIEQIISHEAVHIRQFHSLDILVMELVLALQWFNPVVWFYRKALKETHEYLADREVIAQGFNAEGYRLLLFEQQFGAKLFEFASHLKQSQIKRRMYMMNRMKRAGKGPYKIFLALPLIALLALALAEPRLIIAQGTHADDQQKVAQTEGKPALSEQELKEIQIKFDEKAKLLEAKLNAASTAEEKQKLQQELDDLYKKRQSLMGGHLLVKKGKDGDIKVMEEEKFKELLLKFAEKEKFLKQAYSSADNPEKKEKIKHDLDKLLKERQFLLSESGMTAKEDNPSREALEKKLQVVHEKHLQLEQLIAQEKDQEKRQELKLKYEELMQFEEQLKIKIEELSKKLP